MRVRKKMYVLFAGVFLLASCGCSGDAKNDLFPAGGSPDEIMIAASFQQEDGIALGDSVVRFSFEENSVDYSLDHSGELEIFGLPRSGDLTLTVFDQQEQTRGTMALSVSEGAVIDAVTDESGVGHITLREDTEEVALFFTLKNDGSLLCALRLIQPDSYGIDGLQETN